ncbi:MAG TPA: DUF2306 domain-containing protein [Mucilaginibacter sp.]|nr:DUF2306 domain-containing protein [Mucilaginibacter sp.]
MSERNSKSVRWLWGITIFLVLIGIIIVYRRLTFIAALNTPEGYVPGVTKSNSPVPDDGFAAHPLLTLTHIIPGLLFMLLAPLQFLKRLRTRYPRAHCFMGYIVLVSGLIIGTTAIIMGFTMTIGGITETLAATVFGIAFLFSLLKAYLHIIKREITLHREWMIRALAIGLAVSTTRPIVGIFFATSRFTGLTVHQFFGVAFWIAFVLHVAVAEIWIRHTRKTYGILKPSQA